MLFQRGVGKKKNWREQSAEKPTKALDINGALKEGVSLHASPYSFDFCNHGDI